MGPVVVLTQRLDATADVVIEELNRRRVAVVRCDLDEITVSARLDGARWVGVLTTGSRVARLEEVAGIYYRRPSRPAAPPEVDPQAAGWVETERRWGLRGLLVGLPRRWWVNWPPAVHAAEHKPHTLATAVACGLSVPPTMITNDPAQAEGFATKAGPVVYKAFRGVPVRLDGRTHLTYTTEVSAAQCANDAVRLAPVMLQTRIDKIHDARVTLIDRQVFAVVPRGLAATAPLDWRVDHMRWSGRASTSRRWCVRD